MSDADKIVAAIFTAGMCYGKKHKHAKYLETYDAFIKLMKAREKTSKQETKEPKTKFEGVKRGGRI
jgi:hypothetical protein